MKPCVCPICLKKGLEPAVGFREVKGDVIICTNEFYSHFVRKGVEYIAHTQLNILDEIEPHQLVLN